MRIPLAFALILVPAAAAAEPMAPADRVHDFHTMDRQTPVTTFGVALGYEVWDDEPGTIGDAVEAILGFEVSGHVVTTSGLGGYAVLPLSYLSTEDVSVGPFTFEGDSELAIGNVEVGGMYAAALNARTDLIAHLGVALPTADDDDGVEAFAPFASTPRWGDYVQRVPNTTWLRLGLSPTGSAGPIFWRADLGVDVAISEDDENENAGDFGPVIRLNVAAGVDLGAADVTAELVTNITDPEDEDADSTASTLALGARFGRRNVQPGLAIILPMGFDDAIDELDLAVAASLTFRAQ